jgi:signal recognition particle receptor subunit beta
VLQGADGVAFIADSQTQEVRANQASFKDLRRNLRENGLDPAKLPLVIQYNKRDLPNIRSEEEIKRMAAMGKEPTFLATATHGNGVADTFLGLVKVTWEHLEREHQLRPRFGLDGAEVAQDLARRFGVKPAVAHP